jgi:hypothetical protein
MVEETVADKPDRRAATRRLVFLLGLLAVAIYLGFILIVALK